MTAALTSRYFGLPESTFDYDIKQIHAQGIDAYLTSILNGQLSDAFWEFRLPQELDSSVSTSPSFSVFKAAQVNMDDPGFLSNDIKVRELLENEGDVHHLFPKDYLKTRRIARGHYNQVANYVLAQTEINIQIGNKEPRVYFSELLCQCQRGDRFYGKHNRYGET